MNGEPRYQTVAEELVEDLVERVAKRRIQATYGSWDDPDDRQAAIAVTRSILQLAALAVVEMLGGVP